MPLPDRGLPHVRDIVRACDEYPSGVHAPWLVELRRVGPRPATSTDVCTRDE